MGEARGPVGDADVAKVARDKHAASKLWEMSELLVGEKMSFSNGDHSHLRVCA